MVFAVFVLCFVLKKMEKETDNMSKGTIGVTHTDAVKSKPIDIPIMRFSSTTELSKDRINSRNFTQQQGTTTVISSKNIKTKSTLNSEKNKEEKQEHVNNTVNQKKVDDNQEEPINYQCNNEQQQTYNQVSDQNDKQLHSEVIDQNDNQETEENEKMRFTQTESTSESIINMSDQNITEYILVENTDIDENSDYRKHSFVRTTIKFLIVVLISAAMVLALTPIVRNSVIPGKIYHSRNDGYTLFSDDYAYADEPKTAKEAADLLAQKQEVLDAAEATHFEATSEVERLQGEINEKQKTIDEKNEEIKDIQSRLGDRASSMYRNGGPAFSMLDIILSSTTFSELLQKIEMLRILNQTDADLINSSKQIKAEIEIEKAGLEELSAQAKEKEMEAALLEEEASAAVSEMQAIYDRLNEEEQRKARLEALARQARSSSSSYSYSSAPVYNANTGSAIADRAYAELGKPYIWGGVGPNGYDCSGFVSYCLTGSHTRIGTSETFYYNYPRVSNPQPGDICARSGHVGIYVGNGMMIHASTYGVGVILASVPSNMIYVRG